ncbi:MAG: nucleotide sugar dehydrogenase [Brevinematales bacterium]|jgi:UDP-N-acetyl-D-mannosaminuronic acid dehydrogenase
MLNYDICVIGGAGHVGLPLSLAFADKGNRVVIYDINKAGTDRIANGIMPFAENGCEVLLKNNINKNLFVSDDMELIKESRFIIVVIGTPVDKHLNPDFHSMLDYFEKLLPYLRNDHVIIIRSTVYPGTTEKIRKFLRQTYPGIEVCFCCERILEGRSMEELYSLPQIIAGFSDEAVKTVSALFRLLTEEILVTGVIEAELAKLFTNSWRYIQFATANQFYIIAEEYGADFYETYHAMTYNYPRAKSFPKPGFAAGPCLFKDTMQLSAFYNNNFFLGHSAMLINEGLPNFIVKKLKMKHNLKEKNVGILGMAFKAESDDKRESLSYKLKKIVEFESKAVYCSDPYIHDEGFLKEEELIDKSDIVIIGAPHMIYKDLDYRGRVIVDIWDHIGKNQ